MKSIISTLLFKNLKFALLIILLTGAVFIFSVFVWQFFEQIIQRISYSISQADQHLLSFTK